MALDSPSRPREDLGFDPDALREKYRAERDKRLRPDGNDQYLHIGGELAGYIDDPHVAPGFRREPLHDEVDVAIPVDVPGCEHRPRVAHRRPKIGGDFRERSVTIVSE